MVVFYKHVTWFSLQPLDDEVAFPLLWAMLTLVGDDMGLAFFKLESGNRKPI